MARRRRNGLAFIEIPMPLKGLNMTLMPDRLTDGEASELYGWEIDEYGGLNAPPRANNLGQVVASKCLSAHIFQREGGTTQLIAHFADGSLRYSTDFQTVTTTDASWTTIATGLSTTAPFAFETYLGKVWATNGTNDFRSWDGSTQVTFASAPKGKYLRVWSDVMWVAGVASNEDRLYSSAPGDPTTWPAANFVDIDKGRGFGISGLGATGASLAVFKHQKHFQLFDPVEYSNRLVDPSKGAVSHFGIISHEGQLYFMSHLGICRYLGDGPAEIVSYNINPIFKDVYKWGSGSTTTPFSYASEATVWAYSYGQLVAWVIPSEDFQAGTIGFYPAYSDQPWIRPTNPAFGPVVSLREKGKVAELYQLDALTGGGNNGRLYRVRGEANGDVTRPSSRWTTGWVDLGDGAAEKYLSLLRVRYRGDLTLFIAKDYNDVTWTQIDVPAVPGMVDDDIPIDVHAKSIRLIVISAGGNNERFRYLSSGGAIFGPPGWWEAGQLDSSVVRLYVGGRELGYYDQ